MPLPADFEQWLIDNDPDPPELTGEQVIALVNDAPRPAPPQPIRPPAPAYYQTSWEPDDDYR